MKRLVLPGALLLLLLLAACAPSVSGSSSRMPLQTGSGTQVQLMPGQSVHLVSEFTPEQLGFRDQHFDVVFMTAESARRASGNIANWTGIEPVRMPAFWEAELEQARVVVESGGSSSRRFLEVIWRLDVPASASLGSQDVRIRVSGRGGSQEVTVPVRVRQNLD